jgi:hypothetical protein
LNSLQITSGFSDIKVRLRTKYPTLEMQKFSLWFSFEKNWLVAHEHQDHNKFLILSNYDSKTRQWRHFLPEDSLGIRVIRHGISLIKDESDITEILNLMFSSHGFGVFRRS